MSAALLTPPHSDEAEQSLIGGLLLDSREWEQVAARVSESDFYRDDHRRIFRHIGKLIEAVRPVDVVTVFESLEASNEADLTGGLGYLGEVANTTPSAANVRRYAEIVHERAELRKLRTIGDEIVDAAMSHRGRDVKALVEEVENRLSELSGSLNSPQRRGPVPTPVASRQFMDDLKKLQAGEIRAGLPTGFVGIDEMLGGMKSGDMIVIAGRPSMGKTALAVNIVEHVALDLHKPVAFFSLEMSSQQIISRIVESRGRIHGEALSRREGMTSDDFDRAEKVASQIERSSLSIFDSSLGMSSIASHSRRLHHQTGGLGLIVIDYLQLLSPHRASENRQQEIAEMSRAVKILARELSVPVIVLSQLSRKVEERVNKRPLMSDLRESGAIEQDADVIIMLYREEYYKQNTRGTGVTEVIVGKHRNGRVGTVHLTFRADFTRFENHANLTGLPSSTRRGDAREEF